MAAYPARRPEHAGQGTNRIARSFPDAFIVIALDSWCQKNHQKMYVITKDKAMLRGVESVSNRRCCVACACRYCTVGAHPSALKFHYPDRGARVCCPLCGSGRRSVRAVHAESGVGGSAAISRNPADNLLIPVVIFAGRRWANNNSPIDKNRR